MKKIAVLIVVFSWFVNSIFAQDPQKIYNEANALYHNKKYNEALILYNQLEKQGYSNAELYYNKGNAHFKLKEMGMAVWSYEKALAINPQLTDACENLNIANAQLIDKIEPTHGMGMAAQWNEWLASLNQHLLATLAIIFSFIWLLLLLAFYLKYRNKLVLFKMSFLCLLLAIITYFMAYAANAYKTEHTFAIVCQTSIYLKSSPDEGGVNLVLIHEGLKVEVIEKQASWYKVKIKDGKTGWITQQGIIVI